MAVTSFVQANTNGDLHAAETPSLSPLNRGFLYGDAVYEVWRTYQNALYAWSEHWNRLHASARALHLSIPWSEKSILAEIHKTATAFRQHTAYAGDLYIRLQVFRGAGPIGLDVKLAENPGFVILIKPVPEISAAARATGSHLTVAQSIRRNSPQTLDPAWKTGNYLNNIMGLREARARGADDVVFLNLQGELTESSTSNIAFIRGQVLVTPPLAAGILPGITRATVLQRVAAQAGLAVEERVLRVPDLVDFDEAMLLSSTKDIQPVGSIDDTHYRVDSNSRLWRLKTCFEAHAIAASGENETMRL